MTREMKAATVRVCVVAEWDEAVTGQHRHVAVRVLRTSGGGRALSGIVINLVGTR
jgi:hypothetical protein